MKYRREIDGLRAVAILPVVLFHAGFQAFRGGFVGVDVFFVISGFLITSIIVSERRAGTFTFGTFYERRARRILPALILVVLACLPAAWAWLLPSDMKEFAKSMLAVSLFSSNVFFWLSSGYFDTASELKPLLHTWSLAVEEQFYLFFPLLVLATLKLHRRALVAVVATLSVASFVLCTDLFHLGTSATFFLLPTRAWEMMVGALLAIHNLSGDRRALNLSGKNFLSCASLAAIAYAVFAFDASTPFPSAYALVPTLGAGGILLFADNETWVGRLLGSKAAVGIGLLSYSAYLWHQPVFAFARHAAIDRPSPFTMGALAMLSFFLAYLSWRYVENPFRRGHLLSRKQILACVIALPLLCVAFEKAAHVTSGFESRFSIPAEVAATMVTPNLRTGCAKPVDVENGLDVCVVGDTHQSGHPTAAILGDSHSEALLPAFDDLGKRQALAFVHAGLGGCPPLLDTFVLKGYHDMDACPRVAQQSLDYLKHSGIKRVYLVGRWSLYTDGNYTGHGLLHLGTTRNSQQNRETSREAFKQGVIRTVRAYREAGLDVTIIEQVPQQLNDVRQNYYLLYDKPHTVGSKEAAIEATSVTRVQHQALQRYNREFFHRLAAQGEIQLIQLDDVFCGQSRCRYGEDRRSYYRDADHLSSIGALMTVEALERVIQPTAP